MMKFYEDIRLFYFIFNDIYAVLKKHSRLVQQKTKKLYTSVCVCIAEVVRKHVLTCAHPNNTAQKSSAIMHKKATETPLIL